MNRKIGFFLSMKSQSQFLSASTCVQTRSAITMWMGRASIDTLECSFVEIANTRLWCQGVVSPRYGTNAAWIDFPRKSLAFSSRSHAAGLFGRPAWHSQGTYSMHTRSWDSQFTSSRSQRGNSSKVWSTTLLKPLPEEGELPFQEQLTQ